MAEPDQYGNGFPEAEYDVTGFLIEKGADEPAALDMKLVETEASFREPSHPSYSGIVTALE